jgi:hypothetical protein
MKRNIYFVLILFCISAKSQDLPKEYYEPYSEVNERNFGSLMLNYEPAFLNRNLERGVLAVPGDENLIGYKNYSFELTQGIHVGKKDMTYVNFLLWSNSRLIGTVNNAESQGIPNNFRDSGIDFGFGGQGSIYLGLSSCSMSSYTESDSLQSLYFKTPIMLSLKLALGVPPQSINKDKRRFGANMYGRIKYSNKLESQVDNIVGEKGKLLGVNAGLVLNWYSKPKNVVGFAFSLGIVLDEYLIKYPAEKNHEDWYSQEYTGLALKIGLGISW